MVVLFYFSILNIRYTSSRLMQSSSIRPMVFAFFYTLCVI
nr:MAG TPA: hypothetical protein [Caudoviricetes sp.]